MARVNLIILLVVSILVIVSVAESKRLSSVGLMKKKAPPSTMVCNAVYGAEKGDTCSLVAEMFSLTLDEFLAFNPNINCNSFFVGQWLCVEAEQ